VSAFGNQSWLIQFLDRLAVGPAKPPITHWGLDVCVSTKPPPGDRAGIRSARRGTTVRPRGENCRILRDTSPVLATL